MKLRSTLLAAVASILVVGAADAAPIVGLIQIGGYVSAIGASGFGSATGLDFVQGATGSVNPGTPGGLTSFFGASGSFAGLACANPGGGCGTIKDILGFTSSAPINGFLTLSTGTSTVISFDVSGSVFNVISAQDATGGSLILDAPVTIHFTGLEDTTGLIVLTAKGNQITQFSAYASADSNADPASLTVPEPASFAILGGSLAALCRLRRKQA